jgi:hypothetical protein
MLHVAPTSFPFFSVFFFVVFIFLEVCGYLVVGIAGSNPAEGMDACFLCLYVVLSCVGRGLWDRLITSPEEFCCVCLRNLNTEEVKTQRGLYSHRGNIFLPKKLTPEAYVSRSVPMRCCFLRHTISCVLNKISKAMLIKHSFVWNLSEQGVRTL